MLHRSNIIAVVGGGRYSKFAENTVLIWDDYQQKFVLELTFSSKVVAVHLSHTRLAAVLRRQVHVFSLPQPCARVCTLETRDNPAGLCQLSCDPTAELLCYPGHKIGSLQLLDLRGCRDATSSASPSTIGAHQNELAAVALNKQATLVGTGSVLGTVIRLFETRSRLLLSEFRRGSDPASLSCLRFSADSAFLCVSSDKDTIHVFAVRDRNANRKSLLQQVGIVTEEAQRSLAQVSLPTESPCVCAFGPAQSIIALCMDGTYHKFSFTAEGNTTREGYDLFLDLGDDQQFWNAE